mmetsp:Transcript_27410/g.47310  ORF Transcript_27410/g.47310 Transcript_27410/m.47310 type:complete len:207 (+) Transcript_27410:332-952(+)
MSLILSWVPFALWSASCSFSNSTSSSLFCTAMLFTFATSALYDSSKLLISFLSSTCRPLRPLTSRRIRMFCSLSLTFCSRSSLINTRSLVHCASAPSRLDPSTEHSPERSSDPSPATIESCCATGDTSTPHRGSGNARNAPSKQPPHAFRLCPSTPSPARSLPLALARSTSRGRLELDSATCSTCLIRLGPRSWSASTLSMQVSGN